MNPTTVHRLTKASAAKLAADWTWCQAYFTTCHADAKLLYNATQNAHSTIFFRETAHPITLQHGWLLIRVE